MDPIHINIDGREITTAPAKSIIEAFVESGASLTVGVGCMGQGVCGSCRVLIRRKGEKAVQTALACETSVEDGMQVSSLDYFMPRQEHVYEPQAKDTWDGLQSLKQVFPEAEHCRHCGGCDRACPKGIEVQKGVNAAVAGQLYQSAAIFDECVMCNLCQLGCPEHISPNHLGLFVRRSIASSTLRPGDLMHRLHQLETGQCSVDINSPAAQAPRKD